MDLGRGSTYGRQISTASLGHIQPEDLKQTPTVNLPILVQTDFFHQEDLNFAEWKDLVSFLEEHPAVIEAHRHNKMIPEGGDRPWMLSGTGRGLWQSVAQLVVFNKLRGYDIARALVEGNLLVSPYGTVALKLPIADPYDGSRSFAGYKALQSLFYKVMQKVYGCAVLQLLTLDVKHFMDSLDNVSDDRLPLYHAVFLSPFGRAGLSIRLQSLVRFEVNPIGDRVSIDAIKKFLSNLPDVSEDGKERTDEMHIIFRCLRQHGQKRKARDGKTELVPDEASTNQSEGEAVLKEADEKEQCDLKLDVEWKMELDEKEKYERKIRFRISSGYSVVAIHRNSVLHRVRWKDIVKQVKSEGAEGNCEISQAKGLYCLWEIVQLLHYHMPLHLPRAQVLALENKLWAHLEMGALWPRDEVHHFMTPWRLGPTPDMDPNSMFTYPSYLALSGQTNEDPNNARLHVGGLSPFVTAEDLWRIFGAYGNVVDVKKLPSRSFGFVQFASRAAAEVAMRMLNGFELGWGPIAVSFAHPLVKKGPLFGSHAPLLGGHYAHPQTYNNYAWAMFVLERDKMKRIQLASLIKLGMVVCYYVHGL